MLEPVYKSYRKLADEINWKEYNINELFFKALENKDTDLYEKFYAGIICRVWGYSGRIYRSVNRHIPFEQCYDIVIDAVNYVLEKKVWESPESSLYNDLAGPDKAFHIALRRQRSIVLASMTADKRQSNFNNLSIDSFHEEYNDAAEGLLLLDELVSSESDKSMISYIANYFENKEYIEAFALDFICFNSGDYSVEKIIKLIKGLTLKEYDYYNLVYNLNKEEYNRYIKEIRRSSKQIIEYHVKGLLYKLKKEYIND